MRGAARARDTCTTRAQHNSAHTTVDAQLCTHCKMCCAQPCYFCLEFFLCCVSRDPGGSLLLFSTQRKICSRRTPPSKRRLRRRLERLREACASRGLDQPGVLAAYVEDVLADMEQPALPTDIGVGPIVSIGTPIVYPASSLPASSSSFPLPPSSPPLEFSTSVFVSSASGDALSVRKATAKRVRSRKVKKGNAKRTAQLQHPQCTRAHVASLAPNPRRYVNE